MGSLTFLPIIYSYFYIVALISIPPVHAIEDATIMWYYNCSDNSYTNGSPYETNLKSAVSSIKNQSLKVTNDNKFYNFTVGQKSNRVNAIGWCRKDIPSSDCQTCLNASSYNVIKSCPNKRGAIAWYTGCMFRYSDQDIVGKEQTDPSDTMKSPGIVSDSQITQFNQVVQDLYRRLAKKATTGHDPRGFAASDQRVDGPLEQVYAMVECTPDISASDCDNCLTTAINMIPHCCNTSQGRRVLLPSCFIRSEVTLFYDLNVATPIPPPSQTPPATSSQTPPPRRTPPPRKGSNKLKISVTIGALVTISLIALLSIVTCIILRRSHQRRGGNEIKILECSQFDYRTLREATNNFASANKLGHGGFGVVYQGQFLDGQEIAVKRLSKHSGQGDAEFKNEVLLMSGIQHRNLVKLLGFCLQKEERLLVYEFIPNTSLDKFLFDQTKREQLDWKTRNKVVKGTARGLQYLHEDSRSRIVHRDLKPSNILLDGEMNAKIADFGMARLFHGSQTHADTSRIAGTNGYMAPECVMLGMISTKSDVYSFGVLTLEIISGQRNTSFGCDEEDFKDLLSTAWKSWRDGNISMVVDPLLLSPGPVHTPEIMRCLHIALLCVQEDLAVRPTMSSVLGLLCNDLSLPIPSRPPCYANSSITRNYASILQ